MHQNSYLIFQAHAKKYILEGAKVLEIGPDKIPSTYQAMVDTRHVQWHTLDLYQSSLLTYVATGPYSFPIPDNTYDVVISGQVLEHVPKVWAWMKELARVAKPGGIIITIAPASWPYHEAPLDCWRVYPEGMKALSEEAGLDVEFCAWGSLECPEFTNAIPGRSAECQPEEYRAICAQLVQKHDFPVEKSFDTICIARKPVRIAGTVSSHDDKRSLSLAKLAEAPLTAAEIEVLGAIEPIGGWFTTAEVISLHRLIKLLPNSAKILEIGSYRGRSTNAIGHAMVGTGMALYCLDVWRDFVKQGIRQLDPSAALLPPTDSAIFEDFLQNVEKFGDKIRVFRGATAQFAGVLPGRFFDLIFVDGAHDYENVRRDISLALRCIKPGGIICGHDYHTGGADVIRAVDESVFAGANWAVHGVIKGTSLWFACHDGQEPSLPVQVAAGKIDDGDRNANATVKCDPPLPRFKEANAVPGLTSIIIIAQSRLEQTKKCLKSIRRHTPQDHEIIIVDNASADETVKWLQSQVKANKNCRLYENKEGIKSVVARNQGINLSQGEFIVLMDDDVIVSEGWLSGLLECLKHAPAAGIVGPMTNGSGGLQQVNDESQGSVDYLDKYAAQFKEQFHHRRIPCRNIAGFCMLFKRGLAEKIGLLDERFDAGHFEDEDYCWRSALAGYQNYIAGDVFVRCTGKKATPGDRSIFLKKWTFRLGNTEGKKLAVLKSRELADVMYQKGSIDQVVETLINCIKLTPDAGEIYYDMTRMFIESRRFSEAWEVVGTMPEAVRNDARGLECAGYALEGLGRDDEAAACADSMLSRNEKCPAALNLKGVLSYKKGDRETAADYFRKAIDTDPGYGEAYINLGVIYWGSQQKEAALVHLKKGFMLSPFIPDVNSIYYSVMSSAGLLGEAENDFCDALKMYPCNKNLVFLCIDIFLQQSRHDAALRKIEDILDVFGLDDGLLNAAIDIREKTGPLQIGKAKKKGTLSICMIVKNEEKYLVQCLKSVRDIVDEMIIVDTGSTDKTVAIARIFGAKLFEFPWTGDFSAARNHSLEQAAGHWIFVLDGDEVISPRDHKKIKELISRKSPSLCAYSVATRNYLSTVGGIGWKKNSGEYPEESGAGWVASVKARLFTRNKNVFFSKPVHEILEYSLKKENIPVLPCDIIVHHYGKLDVQKDQQKGEDYYLLGKVKYEADPTNMKSIFELAKQAHLIGKNEESAELFEKLLSLIKTNPDSPSFLEVYQMTQGTPLLEIFTSLAAVYLALDRFDEALNVARRMAADSRKNEANIFVCARCEIIAGALSNAFRELEASLRISPDNLPNLIMMAAVFCLEGNKEKTGEYFEILKQKRVGTTPVFNRLAQELIAYGKKNDALLILNAMTENKITDQETMRLVGVVQNGQGSA